MTRCNMYINCLKKKNKYTFTVAFLYRIKPISDSFRSDISVTVMKILSSRSEVKVENRRTEKETYGNIEIISGNSFFTKLLQASCKKG